MPLQKSISRLVRVERGARLVIRRQLSMSKDSRAVQADRGERSLSSLLPLRFRLFSLRQDESGEMSLMDDPPGSFPQINTSRRGIEETTEMSVMEEPWISKFSIIEQEASGERSER